MRSGDREWVDPCVFGGDIDRFVHRGEYIYRRHELRPEVIMGHEVGCAARVARSGLATRCAKAPSSGVSRCPAGR